MMKTKSTKRALLMSGLALFMCISMLVGSTFAWFTDSVTSVGNKIQAGTLDIDLFKVEMDENWMDHIGDADFNPLTETEITDSSEPIFNDDILWEPGYTKVANLKLVNNGSLALKYQAAIRPTKEVGKLAEVIDVYVCYETINAADGRDSYKNKLIKMGTLKEIMAGVPIVEGEMKTVGETEYFAIVMKMREEAGNDYQGEIAGAFDITVLATQLAHEYDSFDNQYDSNLTVVTNAQELKNALAEGKTPVLPDGSAYEEPEDAIVVWDTDELTTALKKNNNGKTVFLAAGEFTLPQISKTDVKDITIIGSSLSNIEGMKVYKTNVFNNFTFENITFTKDVKAVFYGNCVFKNCDFQSAGITQQSKINKGATLTVENCSFADCMENGALWFQDTVSTINVRNCVFNDSALAFGKSITVTLEECDFNNSQIRCFGPVTVIDSTFDSECMVGPSAASVVDVTIVMNGCSVDNGNPITDICYFSGNPNNVSMIFLIDGATFTTDQVTLNPAA